MAATVAALAKSVSTLARLKPSRSTRGPPSTAGTTAPTPTAAAVRPTFAALPVVSRTNQGTATMIIMLPTCDTAFAPNSAKIGVRSAMIGPCSVTGIRLLLLLRIPAEPCIHIRTARTPNRHTSEGSPSKTLGEWAESRGYDLPSVTKVMSSSCSHLSPVKKRNSSIKKLTRDPSSAAYSATSLLSRGKPNISRWGLWASTKPSL
jgi:hypothetical protein